MSKYTRGLEARGVAASPGLLIAAPASSVSLYQSRLQFERTLSTKGLHITTPILSDLGASDRSHNTRNTRTEGNIKNKFQEVWYLGVGVVVHVFDTRIRYRRRGTGERVLSPGNEPSTHGEKANGRGGDMGRKLDG